jgi:hypothetical protein
MLLMVDIAGELSRTADSLLEVVQYSVEVDQIFSPLAVHPQ